VPRQPAGPRRRVRDRPRVHRTIPSPRASWERRSGAPRAFALRESRASAASQWWAANSTHRASLASSLDGAYRTHIALLIDEPWPEVTASDCERPRNALDANARDGAIAGKTAFNVWSVWTTACEALPLEGRRLAASTRS
jgi:hypothetical protein